MSSLDTSFDRAHANYAGRLAEGCVVCGYKDYVEQCENCKLVLYCCDTHKLQDWHSHKASCWRAKTAEKNAHDEEEKLRAKSATSESFLLPRDIFDTHAGYFWDILATRPYMLALAALVESRIMMKSVKAVQQGLSVCMEMHRLCRGDNQGTRYMTPTQFIRLGKDQECYDFLKWWATSAQDPNYDAGNMAQSYLDTKGADVFESPDVFLKSRLVLLVPLFLVKARLVLDLIAIRSQISTGKTASQVFDEVRPSLLTNVLDGRQYMLELHTILQLLNLFQDQLEKLYLAVLHSNRYFWSALLQPGASLTTYPEHFSPGDLNEMQVVLKLTYPAWVETPGAFRIIERRHTIEINSFLGGDGLSD